MKRRWVALLSALVVVLFSAAMTAFTHHSFEAQYDRNKPFTLKGKITKVEWMNPHIYFYVDVVDETGAVTNWAIEGGAPNGLYRRGWRRESLPIGDEITVEGWLAKDGSNALNSGSIMASDGTRLLAGSSNPDAEDSDR